MAKDILSRYIWIIDTIRRYGHISRKELDRCWRNSPYANGDLSIPRRTFFNYRNAIEELFSLSIECDPRTYEYYIVEPEKGDITEWLLNSSATNSVLQGARDVAGKILLEDVPSAREHLSPIMDALRGNHPVTFDYHPYTRSQPTRGVTIEPYFLRIYRQLWYVTGLNTADGKVKTYSLDRISNLRINTGTFTPPPDADPAAYFRDSFGIMVTQSEARTVKLKVDTRQAKYFRALPLHASQQEMVSDRFSIFTYTMRITPDLVNELLSFGPRITVLTPPELRAMVVSELTDALANYNSDEDGRSPEPPA